MTAPLMAEAAQLEQFRALVARQFGLHYDDGKLDFLSDVLSQRLEATGLTRFDAYLQYLGSPVGRAAELRALVDRLTVNETFFFRNVDNFRALAEEVLPQRVRANGGEKRLRILSAGCASGEEPYSIAIVLREALPELDRWDLQILAVDLSAAMLAKAASGRFSGWSLRGTPEDVRQRHFVPDGRDFVLDPRVRAMVTFEERNLVDAAAPFPPASFDVVFCRNVIMYFTPEVMRDVVGRFARALVPGGSLFLGHAETLRGLSQEFHLCHTGETFYYQKRAGLPGALELTPLSWPGHGAAASLPEVIDGASSWVSAIQQASARIAALSAAPAQPGADGPAPSAELPPATRSWDLGLVLEAMRQERFPEALALLAALPAEAQGDVDALLLRAALLTNSGRLGEAEASCAQLLAKDELNAGAHYLMALCREHARDRASATEHDLTAIYLDRTFAMPHLHLGLMAKRERDHAATRHALSTALALLEREDAARLLLFGGGFTRDALLALCRAELQRAGSGA